MGKDGRTYGVLTFDLVVGHGCQLWRGRLGVLAIHGRRIHGCKRAGWTLSATHTHAHLHRHAIANKTTALILVYPYRH